MDNVWQLQEAKAKFSEFLDRALSQGVQIVTRRGKKTAVLMSYEEYERLTQKKESLADFFLRSPLAGTEIEFERDKSLPRNIDIEP